MRSPAALGIRKVVLWGGIAANLGLLGYFKYANFFVDSINSLVGSNWNLEKIILPLAISFFTFQQVTYLVDTYRGKQSERNFLRYCLFVSFFPQLIAGPIVHHSEMLPQFSRPQVYRFELDRIAIGLTIFFLGLFKKTVLADNVGPYADEIFLAADQGEVVTFLEAWIGVLSYTFQIYFDFSGYSDMAIGLGFLFGIRLPVNFLSPYRSQSIVEFWRRWHITLSRFLKDYLYIPLGGNRRGRFRKQLNLMTTMILGGLWHGAGGTFIIWGALHGFYLLVNHAWRALPPIAGLKIPVAVSGKLGWMLTFLCVVLAWIFFRATSVDSALHILAGVSGMNGVVFPDTYAIHLGSRAQLLSGVGIQFSPAINLPYFNGINQIITLFSLLVICLFMPNIQEFTSHWANITSAKNTKEAAGRWWRWRPSLVWSVCIGIIAAISVVHIAPDNKFLYFNF